MENLFGSVGMIRHTGINGGIQKADIPFTFVHTSDIARVAAQRLKDLNFTGFSHEFITGPVDLTFAEVTSTIGNAIGKPDLPYVEFSPADGKAGMLQAGLSETIADAYVEMSVGMNKGYLNEGYDLTQATQGKTTLEWFVENQLRFAFEN